MMKKAIFNKTLKQLIINLNRNLKRKVMKEPKLYSNSNKRLNFNRKIFRF